MPVVWRLPPGVVGEFGSFDCGLVGVTQASYQRFTGKSTQAGLFCPIFADILLKLPPVFELSFLVMFLGASRFFCELKADPLPPSAGCSRPYEVYLLFKSLTIEADGSLCLIMIVLFFPGPFYRDCSGSQRTIGIVVLLGESIFTVAAAAAIGEGKGS